LQNLSKQNARENSAVKSQLSKNSVQYILSISEREIETAALNDYLQSFICTAQKG